jgi:hypothetical protein
MPERRAISLNPILSLDLENKVNKDRALETVPMDDLSVNMRLQDGKSDRTSIHVLNLLTDSERVCQSILEPLV